MALIYNKTNWKDDESTPINARNLNNIEDGVEYIYEKWDDIISDATTGDHAAEMIDARNGPGQNYKTLGQRLNNFDSQIKEKANDYEVRKNNVDIDLNDFSPRTLEAIQNSQGTSFNVLSVPKDNSVSSYKTDFLVNSNNLLDENNLVKGYLNANGTITPATYYTTMFIPFDNETEIRLSRFVKDGEENMMTGRVIRKACFYSEDYTVVTDYFYDNISKTVESVRYLGDENVKYIRVSFIEGFKDGKTMLYYGAERTQFEKFKYTIENLSLNDGLKNEIKEILEKDKKDVLYGKTIASFGDSIMRGAGNNNIGVVDLLGKKYNMNVHNNAISGATIMNTSGKSFIYQQIENYNGNPDYIVMDGYINDCVDATIIEKLGEVSPYFGGTFNNDTFTGQLETMLKYMTQKFVGAKIVYVFVHKMGSRTNDIVKQVHAKTKEACKKWSIPYVDLYEEGILNTTLDMYANLYTDNADKTHPNELGYNKYYIPQIEAKLKII